MTVGISFKSKMMSTSRPVYGFPPIKLPEIIQCLHELGIPCTEAELSNPEKYKEQCQLILEELSEICTGITREEMNQPAFSGLSALSYPDLHEESISFLNTFRACAKMMEICGVQDFSLKDFVNPTPKRLIVQLSGIINFAKFREERLCFQEDLTNSRQNILDRYSHVTKENESLKERLSRRKVQTEEESEQVLLLEKQCKALEAHISTLNKRQQEIREDSGELKAQNNELKDAISSESVKLEELQSLRKRLAAQIVSSPEKFRKQILDVGHALQVEQKDAKSAERRVRELTTWITSVEEAQGEVDSALESIQELRSEVEKQKSYLSELDVKKQLVSTKSVMTVELEQNSNQLSRQVTRAEEKLNHFKKTSSARQAEAKLALEDQHQQLTEAVNHRSQVSNGVSRAESDALRMEKDLEAESAIQQQELNDILQTYKRLEKSVTIYLSNLSKAMVVEN